MLVKAFDEIYDKTEDDILEVSNDIRECITPDDIDHFCILTFSLSSNYQY